MVEPGSPPATKPPARPRWVKNLGIAAAVVILGAVLIMALAGGEHGPGRHTPGGGNGAHTPPVQHAP